jgi:hypothetical protein
MPAGLEQPKGFVAQLLRAGHMLDHLRGNDRLERLIFDRDVQNITDDVNAVLARLNNVAAPIFRNGIKDLPVRFIAAADIQKSAFKVPPPRFSGRRTGTGRRDNADRANLFRRC